MQATSRPVPSPRPIAPIRAPRARRPRVVPPRSYALEQLASANVVVGHGIVLFTMFYCTLNWAHYRRLRRDLEDGPEEKR